MKDRMAVAERKCLSESADDDRGTRLTQAQLSKALARTRLQFESNQNNKEGKSTATTSKTASDPSDKPATNLNDNCSESQGLRRSPRKALSIVTTPSKTGPESSYNADTNLKDNCSEGQGLRRSPRKALSIVTTPSKTGPESSYNADTNLKDNCSEGQQLRRSPRKRPSKKDGDLQLSQLYCQDQVAHIATDMQQIQSVPRLQIGLAWYKSKVSNETIITKNIKQFNID